MAIFSLYKNCIFNNSNDDFSSNARRDTNSFAYPSEIYLANGHVFEILCTGSTGDPEDRMIGYNIVVIPE